MNIVLILLALAVVSLMFSLKLLMEAIYYSKRASLRILGGVREHKKWIDRFLWSLLPPVVFIESVVRLEHGRWGSDTLFFIHMCLVASLVLVLYLMRMVWTGEHNRRRHILLSKYFFISFLLVVITGGMLIAQLFMKN